jgi:hypothetical protein
VANDLEGAGQAQVYRRWEMFRLNRRPNARMKKTLAKEQNMNYSTFLPHQIPIARHRASAIRSMESDPWLRCTSGWWRDPLRSRFYPAFTGSKKRFALLAGDFSLITRGLPYFSRRENEWPA